MHDLPVRRRNRLRNFDYTSSGAYFVTVCTAERTPLLARIEDGCLRLTPEGTAVAAAWQWLGTRHCHAVQLDAWVVMPDHVHGVLCLTGNAPMPLGRYIAAFKGISTRLANVLRATPGAPLWQRSYHDTVVRDEHHLAHIRQYIAENPARWLARHP